jgi:hypothetical protein
MELAEKGVKKILIKTLTDEMIAKSAMTGEKCGPRRCR